jgi:hypothetical protein
LAVLGLFAFGLLGHGGIVHEIRYRKSDRSPIHLLHRASQAVGQIFAAGMRTNDLTPRQLAVLVAVAENEGLSQADLVERTGVDRSTLADIVKRLKGKGLLQRRRTREDARLRREAHQGGPQAPARGRAVGEARRRADSGWAEFMSALASVVAALQKPNST